MCLGLLTKKLAYLLRVNKYVVIYIVIFIQKRSRNEINRRLRKA